jgi:tRNA threonylcarbamoyladenosine biosynthesis protein TsaB
MKILAWDTSGRAAAFAALQLEAGAAQVRGLAQLGDTRELSRHIIARLESTLDAAGWTLDDVDALAVGLGPGSWTGLRIGVTTAKTLAQTRGVPLAGVPLFDAMAQSVWRRWETEYSLPAHGLLLTAAPCRPGELYAKLFECHPQYLAVAQAEWIGTPEMLAGALAAEALARDLDTTAVVAGAASPLHLSWPAQSEILLPDVALPEIVTEIGLAGAARLEEGATDDPLALQPLYLAPSAAERNLIAQTSA